MFSEKFKEAAGDYRFLLDRSYPQKATIKLVGDRYQLSGVERSLLYRGISDAKSAALRRAKIIDDPGGAPLYIDCYNILFTIGNYLTGRPVFIADDGILRDSGELRGRFGNKKIFEQTIGLVEEFMIGRASNDYHFLLDAPVSNSGRLASRLHSFLKENKIRGEAQTVRSPDHELISRDDGVVCSSDSVIMTRVAASIYDLPRYILFSRFNVQFDDISSIL